MQNLNDMNISSTRGIFLSVALMLSVMLISAPSSVYGEGVSVTDITIGETSLLELTNNSNNEISTVSVWLGDGFNFKTYKTEKGWVGEKNAQGTILFTSPESIKPGKSVKFGIKADRIDPIISWEVRDNKGGQIDTGVSVSKVTTSSIIDGRDQNTQDVKEPSMTTDSTFRIVPDKPNVGSAIRVTGDNFGSLQEFDFYIDTKKLGSFETDQNGHFMTTMKIPDDQIADRADFMIKDKNGEEKKISLRVGEMDNRIPDSPNIPITIKGIPNIVHRGEFLEVFGTGDPDSAITAKIKTPNGDVINARTADVDSKGDWRLEEPVIVPLNAPFGKYSAEITDGKEDTIIYWTVESDKKIVITPTGLKFERGETIKFNGTALPNLSLEMVLEDPLGKEIVSDIIQIDASGVVNYQYITTQDTVEGTYTLIATQQKEKEFIHVGVGQLPIIPVNLEFDKLSYKTSDTAIVTLSGVASEIISLLIIDPSDKPIDEAVTIILQPDGRSIHNINLTGYTSGVYTAVASKGSAKSTETFTVGLQIGVEPVEATTTKDDYEPGDSILILGNTSPNALLTMTLLDPQRNEIKAKETFSDKNGKISVDSFRVPSDAQAGVWMINVRGGTNFVNIEIDVITSATDGMIVSVEEGKHHPGTGDTIIIKVFGAKQNVEIDIISGDGDVIVSLDGIITQDGVVNQIWGIPKNTEPGTYRIVVTNPTDSAETTFDIR